jgi:deoxyribose-phosphate aldolase
MPRVPVRIDAVMLEARAAELAKRSFKDAAKDAALELIVGCMDLTTLEGKDTPGKVRQICARGISPAPGMPSVAAICVYPNLVAIAREALRGSRVHLASVATAFPSGLSPLDIKLREVRAACDGGADEIDMVIDRNAFLCGDDATVLNEIVAVKAACEGKAQLKVILEVGELGSYAAIRRACDLALAGGADFLKTSTGKIGISSTPAIALAMCEAIGEHHRRTGARVGLKLAGGIRTAKQAFGYIAIVHETLGATWLQPDLFRIGASSLLDDVLLQHLKRDSGNYAAAAYVATA